MPEYSLVQYVSAEPLLGVVEPAVGLGSSSALVSVGLVFVFSAALVVAELIPIGLRDTDADADFE